MEPSELETSDHRSGRQRWFNDPIATAMMTLAGVVIGALVGGATSIVVARWQIDLAETEIAAAFDLQDRTAKQQAMLDFPVAATAAEVRFIDSMWAVHDDITGFNDESSGSLERRFYSPVYVSLAEALVPIEVFGGDGSIASAQAVVDYMQCTAEQMVAVIRSRSRGNAGLAKPCDPDAVGSTSIETDDQLKEFVNPDSHRFRDTVDGLIENAVAAFRLELAADEYEPDDDE